MALINLTPHTVMVCDEQGNALLTLPPSGAVARVSVSNVADGNINGLPVYRQAVGEVVGLPEPKAGDTFVTSLLVRTASGRSDVLSPGELVRDAAGQPVGCKGLVRN